MKKERRVFCFSKSRPQLSYQRFSAALSALCRGTSFPWILPRYLRYQKYSGHFVQRNRGWPSTPPTYATAKPLSGQRKL